MSDLWKIAKKEIKELLTPAAIVPLIAFALIFGMIGNLFGGVEESLGQKPVIGLIVNDRGEFGSLANLTMRGYSNVVYNGSSIEEGIGFLEEHGGLALLLIPENFTERIMNNESGIVEVYWLMRGSGFADIAPLETVSVVLSMTSREISVDIIEKKYAVDSAIALEPVRATHITYFKQKIFYGASPQTIGSIFGNQMFVVPLIIVMVVIMAGSMVINSMGTEKENKTLETLLTLPVGRVSIVFGKLLGAGVVGLIAATIYMLGLGYYMYSLTASQQVDFADLGVALTATDYVLIGISLFLTLMSALALCMIIGIFTKNFKAAQSMIFPVMMLAFIPMFVLMAYDFGTLPLEGQTLIFAIPFSHPMMAVRELMSGNLGMVIAGIAYQSVFMVVSIYIAVELFKRDILLTGRVKSAEKKKTGWPLLDVLLRIRRK
ncbi:MAG: ABC transporter permease [Thermoplasmata archaeon]